MIIKHFETYIEQNDVFQNGQIFTPFEAYLHILKNSGSQCTVFMKKFSSESKCFVFTHCVWFMLQYCATFTFSRKIFFTKIKLSHNLQIQTDPKSFVKCIFCKKGCRTLNTKENAKNVKMHKNSSRKLKVAIQKLTFSKMGQY